MESLTNYIQNLKKITTYMKSLPVKVDNTTFLTRIFRGLPSTFSHLLTKYLREPAPPEIVVKAIEEHARSSPSPHPGGLFRQPVDRGVSSSVPRLSSLRAFHSGTRLFSGSVSVYGTVPVYVPVSSFCSGPGSASYHYDTEWTLTEGCRTYQEYYEKVLRPILRKCYPKMSSKYPWEKQHYLVGVNDLVSAVLRYPNYFRKELENEIIDKRVAVEDPELPYPSFISGPRLVLRNPIQIITPLLPPLGFHRIYTDGCPNLKHGFPCGGGVAIVNGWPGKLTAFRVGVAHGDPLETELRVIIAAARYALKEGFTRVIFVSDCLDIIQGLQGGRYIRKSIRSLIRELLAILDGFEETVFEHCPREGLALVDALARQMKATLEFQTINCPDSRPKEGDLCMLNYETQLTHVMEKWRKLDKRVPVFRFEVLRNLPPKATPEDIALMQWFCPKD